MASVDAFVDHRSGADVTHALAFDNTYARLPERFFARLAPTPVRAPRLLRLNDALAHELGLDPETLASPAGVEMLAGNRVPDGAEPLAMVYAGFQFGGWVPRLGDGRAILLGEVVDRNGVRHDVQLKGSGPTPFSRQGDGRAGVGPVLREYVVSEAMAALGIPTTRALAAVATGETIVREGPLPGAILTRVAQSHVRVGTFQYFAGQRDVEGLRALADYVIDRHSGDRLAAGSRPAGGAPPAAGASSVADDESPYLRLLDDVIGRQAELVAQWQLVGFIHGVMNTDNTSIAGETIDYGPCAFMDAFHPDTVYSSIDRMGRYAYRNQPPIAHWNLAGFAQALLPLMDDDPDAAVARATAVLETFRERFESAYRAGLRRKLGLGVAHPDDDALADDLLARMAQHGADFTLTFRRLASVLDEEADPHGSPRTLFDDPAAFDEWAAVWRRRVTHEGRPLADVQADMLAVNPAYIPRNHLVEEVIRAAVDRDDYAPFERLLEVTRTPFAERPGLERYMAPPQPHEVVRETFCGT